MTATLNKEMNTLSLINLIIYLDLIIMHQRTEDNMKLSYIFIPFQIQFVRLWAGTSRC